MYFRMIPAVIRFSDNQQSRELRRIRMMCSTVYLHVYDNYCKQVQVNKDIEGEMTNKLLINTCRRNDIV